MGDQIIDKLTGSIEDLSLKKQLPLRQHAQKAMLNYSNNAIKPVHLFNHADLISMRSHAEAVRNAFSNAEAVRNAFSSLGQSSGTSTMSTPFRSSVKPMPSAQTPYKQTIGVNGCQSQSSGPLETCQKLSPSKGHSNPYARPVSAKDIAADLQHIQLGKTSTLSQMQSVVGPLFKSGGSGAAMLGFQMNSFMHPRSAFRRDESPQKAVSADSKYSINSDNSAAQSVINTNHGAKNAQISPKKVAPPSKLEREPDLSEIIKTDYLGFKAGNQTIKNHFVPAVLDVTKQGTSYAANCPSDSSTVTAVSQFTSSTISKLSDSSSGKGVLNNDIDASAKAAVYVRPTSSLPRPGSIVPPQKSMSTDLLTNAYNLNYTPTKPYQGVAEPLNVSGKSPVCVNARAQQTLETIFTVRCDPQHKQGNAYVAQSYTSKLNETKSAGLDQLGSKQYDVTSSVTLYKRECKSDTCLNEQRPLVVGAPSNLFKGTEKRSATNLPACSELDEGDEESEVPSGERLPGDGEASLFDEDDDFEDLDEDVVDNLEEDNIGGSDGESDGYSITSSSMSCISLPNKSICRPMSDATSLPIPSCPQMVTPDHAVKPALTKSYFPSIPPVVTFIAEGEKVEQLPWDIKKYLKWKMSPITPNVVKQCLARSGFRISKHSYDWLGCWGKHMKSPGFRSLREYQKINHYPGSFQIGRKDRLWRNLSKMQAHFGKKDYGFFPHTYCLPQDAKLLKRAFEDGGPKQKWIVKPPASARGIGIKVINKITQVPKKKPVIVQKYLSRPYLINDSKFDCRIYVYVSSFDPLRLYVFEDGLARFASTKYSTSMKHLSNKFIHLTNYSVNKKNAEYQSNSDETTCQGHKWSLKALWNYMKRQGVNTTAVWDNMKDLIVKTIICADAPVNSLVKANCKCRYSVHELFGFDILLDENLRPWILEVNISPSLHSNSQLDVHIKGQMIKDLFNISGIRVPDKQDLGQHQPQNSGQPDLSMYIPSNSFCMDKRLFCQQLSPDERAKHAYYSQRYQDEQVQQTILDLLTPDDIRCLTESIDEDARKGGFQRVFPTPSTRRYLKYFDTPRYYNLLLDQWVQRYNRMEHRGIALLQSFCKEKIHLELNTSNSNHQWVFPSAMCHSQKEGRLLSAPTIKQKELESLKSSASSSSLVKTNKHVAVQKIQFKHSLSQPSSLSSVHNLVFSPQPMNLVSPKGRVPNR